MVGKVLLLQTFVRSNCKRKLFALKRSRAIDVQRVWKPKINAWVNKREKEAGNKLTGVIKRKLYKMREKRYLTSTLVIQRVWRGRLTRNRYGRYNRAAIVIQNMVRFDDSKAEFARRHKAVKVVRKFMIRSCLDLRAQRQGDGATTIQRIIRGTLGKRGVWAMVWSALWIQKAWRGYLVRRNARFYTGVLKLQSSYRGGRDRQRVLEMVMAAQRINNWYWRKGVEKKARAKESCARIQAWTRGIMRKLDYAKLLRSMVALQCWARCLSARGEFEERRRMTGGALILQCWARCLVARGLTKRLREATKRKSATIIQTTVRRFLWALAWKEYGKKPFRCAVSIAKLLAYFQEGAVELWRKDVEWFLQFSHVKMSVDESWLEAGKKEKTGVGRARSISFLIKHQDNVGLAVHRTTVVGGGENSWEKVEGKSFELYDCQPSHTLHIFLFLRKIRGGGASLKEDVSDADDIYGGLKVDTGLQVRRDGEHRRRRAKRGAQDRQRKKRDNADAPSLVVSLIPAWWRGQPE